MTQSEVFSTARWAIMALIGLYLVTAGLSSLLLGTESGPWTSPLGWILGGGGALIIFGFALRAGPRAVAAASDELYRANARRAWAFGYWFGVFLYPPAVALIALALIDLKQAVVAVGTLFAGVPLLYFAWLEWRMGQ